MAKPTRAVRESADPDPATVGAVLNGVLGSTWRNCPSWPPDVFAATATVLLKTGAYTAIVDLQSGASSPILDTRTWPDEADRNGKEWRRSLDSDTQLQPPDLVSDSWRSLVAHANTPVHLLRRLSSNPASPARTAASALIALCTIADSASRDIGTPTLDSLSGFARRTERYLMLHRQQSVCSPSVSSATARVLPKQHTPQRGLTLRSLSHHLALVPVSEVVAAWSAPRVVDKGVGRDEVFGVLVLPWPLHLETGQFRLVPDEETRAPALAHPYRFFAFHRPDDPATLRRYMKAAISEARRSAANLRILVFPELALTRTELRVAREIAARARCLLIAGVAVAEGEELDGQTGPKNLAAIAWQHDAKPDRIDLQAKHHRWCLDAPQIQQYSLTSTLPTSRLCWEHTQIGARDLQFWTIASWLSFTVLICEDLARPDPVAEILRAVGPNLVFALLMDGPQLLPRWGAKYASVLAEDPGCSVLTLTSLGMALRSRPSAATPDRRRVVALWRDPIGGAQEIELAPGHHAAVLDIVCQTRTEYTCDGRNDGATAFFPVLSGFRSLAADASQPPRKRGLPRRAKSR